MAKVDKNIAEFKSNGIKHVSKNKAGNYVARFPFFYKMGKTTKDAEEFVKKAIPGVVIVSSQEIYKPFRGGAPVAKQSHWMVEFKIS